MRGMNQTTGKTISGMDHLRQSLARLFTTPVGSRVMRRDYGCHLFEMIDQPGNSSGTLKIYAVIVDSILRWEPRLLPTQVSVSANSNQAGSFDIILEGITTQKVGDIAPGSSIEMSVPIGI